MGATDRERCLDAESGRALVVAQLAVQFGSDVGEGSTDRLEIVGQQAERSMTSERGNRAEITSVECQHLHSFVSLG